jgi:hypothetical protein
VQETSQKEGGNKLCQVWDSNLGPCVGFQVHAERALRRTFAAQFPAARMVLVDDSKGLACIMAAAEFFMLLHCQPCNVGYEVHVPGPPA